MENEKKYLHLVDYVLKNGVARNQERTGAGTKAVFGVNLNLNSIYIQLELLDYLLKKNTNLYNFKTIKGLIIGNIFLFNDLIRFIVSEIFSVASG